MCALEQEASGRVLARLWKLLGTWPLIAACQSEEFSGRWRGSTLSKPHAEIEQDAAQGVTQFYLRELAWFKRYELWKGRRNSWKKFR